VLVQHGACVFSSDRKGTGSPTEYRTSCDSILRILRYPRYIYTAKTLYGDTGELIIEELLQRGHVTMSSTVKTVADRLTQNMEGQYLNVCIDQRAASPSVIEGMFQSLTFGLLLNTILVVIRARKSRRFQLAALVEIKHNAPKHKLNFSSFYLCGD